MRILAGALRASAIIRLFVVDVALRDAATLWPLAAQESLAIGQFQSPIHGRMFGTGTSQGLHLGNHHSN